MAKTWILFILSLMLPIAGYPFLVNGKVQVQELRCEYLVNPLGVDVLRPRLSWILASKQRGQKQTAYQILVATSEEALKLNQGDLWDSGKIESDQSVQVEYNGKPLKSQLRCYWKVRVWDKDGRATLWSEQAMWSMGLFELSDWQAQWIGSDEPTRGNGESADINGEPALWLRKVFRLSGKPKLATVYIATLGYSELFMNGNKVSKDVMSPAPADYRHRANYLTYDVTDKVQAGDNCVGVWLFRGWVSHVGFKADWSPVKIDHNALVMVHLDITMEDGRRIIIGSDEAWKFQPSNLKHIGDWIWSDFGGDSIDARKAVPDWSKASLNDSSWKFVKVGNPSPHLKITAQKVEPDRIIEAIKPVRIQRQFDEYLVDMGRHYTGWFEMKLRGEPGQPVTLNYEECLKCSEPYYSTLQNDEYIPASRNEEIFCNRFIYHAFRWVRVKGLAAPPKPEDITGYRIHSTYKNIGEFACSNELLTKVYNTAIYTLECLSINGYLHDCPHRERCGYGAEGQVGMEPALFNFGMGPLFANWMQGWRDAQDITKIGEMPPCAPVAPSRLAGPAYGGIIITLPWEAYLHFNDGRFLEENYPAMKKYIAYLDDWAQGNLLRQGDTDPYGFIADWNSPGRQQGFGPFPPVVWTEFWNNCYYKYITALTGRIAAILGKPDEASFFRQKADQLAWRIHATFFDPQKNIYASEEMPYLAMPLMTGIVPEKYRQAMMENLIKDVLVTRKGHVQSGVLGTYFMLKFLTRINRDDLIFTMANQTTYPGWGWILGNGATTFGERWDGGHSQIHTSFVSIGSWFTEGIGGIRYDENAPGFKHFFIRPGIVGDLTWAKAIYNSIHGKIVSDWKIEDGSFYLNIEVPANTTATVYIPAVNAGRVMESGLLASNSKGIRFMKIEGDSALYQIESGMYSFASPFVPKR